MFGWFRDHLQHNHEIAGLIGRSLLMLAATIVNAAAEPVQIPSSCFAEASARFGIKDAQILRALVSQESSGRCPLRHGINADGSYDIGCMGINSSWLPLLQKNFGISEGDLYEPCINIHVGTWVYARNIRQLGDTWQAVGAYNAQSEPKRIDYAWKIYRHLNASH